MKRLWGGSFRDERLRGGLLLGGVPVGRIGSLEIVRDVETGLSLSAIGAGSVRLFCFLLRFFGETGVAIQQRWRSDKGGDPTGVVVLKSNGEVRRGSLGTSVAHRA